VRVVTFFAIRVLVVQAFAVLCLKIKALTHLFAKVHTYLDQETAKQRNNLFGLRVKLPIVTTILTTKGKGNSTASVQLKETTSELVCLFLHYSINV